MKATEKYTIIALSLLSTVCMYFKCEKDLPIPVCSSNCNGVYFSGNVLNVAYNTPIKDAQIKITTPGGFGAGVDTIYIIGTVNTAANGDFSLIKSIDTTAHREYTIKATMPSGYLVSPETSDQYSTSAANTESQYFYILDSSLQHIQFTAFPVTRLAVKFHRSSPLSTTNGYINVSYSITNGSAYPIGQAYSFFQENSKNTDTLIYLETSPVFNTVIQWVRNSDNSGTVASGADSISCEPNTTNQISITY